MKLSDRIKNITHGVSIIPFLLTCFFVVYGMINISTILWIQVIMGVMGLYTEYEIWYMWGLSFADKKYIWLRAVCVIYVTIFSLFSGIGFFATEVITQEVASKKTEIIETNNQARILQLYRLIDTAQKTMDYERDKNNGIGPNYRKAEADLRSYNQELADRLNPENQQVKIKVKAQVKDMFANLSTVLWNIPKNILIIIMFGCPLFVLYLKLFLKPMNIKLHEDTLKPSQIKDLAHEAKNNKSDVAPEVTKQAPATLHEDVVQTSQILQEEVSKKDISIDSLQEHNKKPDISVSIDQLKQIYFAESLYDTEDPYKSLKPFAQAHRDIMDKGITYRESDEYYKMFRDWKAIEVKPGTTSKAIWPLNKLKNKIMEG